MLFVFFYISIYRSVTQTFTQLPTHTPTHLSTDALKHTHTPIHLHLPPIYLPMNSSTHSSIYPPTHLPTPHSTTRTHIYPPAYSYTHLLTHPHTYSPTHLLTHPLTYHLIHAPTRIPSNPCTHSLIHPPPTHTPFTYSSIHPPTYQLIHSHTHLLFTHPSIYLPTHTLTRPLTNSSNSPICVFLFEITYLQRLYIWQMAMCLSSSVGKKVSRQLPFSNAGSVSANVELTIPKYSDVFIAAPNKFQIRPGTVSIQLGTSDPKVVSGSLTPTHAST